MTTMKRLDISVFADEQYARSFGVSIGTLVLVRAMWVPETVPADWFDEQEEWVVAAYPELVSILEVRDIPVPPGGFARSR